MSVTASQLIAQVSAQGIDKTKSDLQSVGDSVNQTGGIFKSGLGGALSFAAGMAGQALGFLSSQVEDGIGLAIQHQQVMQQTAQALKSTGDASGMTADAIASLAQKQQNLTGINKDTIESAENLELTFTGIGKDIFPQVTQMAEDMSVSLHEDLSSAMMQLSKAINDPKQGMTALTREGVTFSDAEKQMITQMEAAGDTAGAQKVMLGELQKEFGGSAEAAGKTFGGQLQILKERLDDVKEKIGTALMPVLQGLMDKLVDPAMDAAEGLFHKIGDAAGYVGNVLRTVNLSDFLAAWQSVKSATHDLTETFGELGAKLHPVATDFDPLADKIQSLASGGLKLLTNALGDVYVGLSSVDGAFHGGKGPIEDFGNALKPWAGDVQNIAGLLSGQFKQALQFVGDEAKQVGGWFQSSVVPALKDAEPGFLSLGHVLLENVVPAVIQIRGVIQDVVEHAFKKLGPVLGEIVPPLIRFAGILAGDIATGLKIIAPIAVDVAKVIGQFAKMAIDGIVPLVNLIISQFKPVWTELATVFNTQIKPAVENMIKSFQPAIPFFEVLGAILAAIGAVIMAVVVGAIKGVITAIGPLISGLAQAIGGIIQIFAGVFQVIGGIISFFVDLFTGHFSNLGNDLGNIMGGIVTMFVGIWQVISGIFVGAFGAIWGFVSGFVDGFLGFFKFLYDELIGHSIIPDIVNGAISWFQHALDMIFGFFGGIGQWFHDRFTEAYNGIKDALGAVGGWVHDNLVAPFENGLGRIGGVFQSIAKLISDATSLNFGAIPGDLHGLGIPGFASGTSYAPGGLAQLAENGMELVTGSSVGYLPRGAKVYSAAQTAQMLSGGYAASGGAGQPIILMLDGRAVGRGVMPHVVSEIRNRTGVRI